MRNLILFMCLLATSSCAQGTNNKEHLNPQDALFKQYAYLLQRSLQYNREHPELITAIQHFIDTNREYDFRKYARLEPIILSPILINNDGKKLLVMILKRTTEGEQDNPAEYIRFLYIDRMDSNWIFHLKHGYTRSFSYAFGHPIVSDQELTLNVLRDLIDAGYMEPLGYKINDDFFNDDW